MKSVRGRRAWDRSVKCCKKVIALMYQVHAEFCRRKSKERRADNIEFVQGGFLTYNHRGELADAVISQLALHHLPDFWKLVALKRVFKMLKDGGRLYLRDVVFPSDVEDYDHFFNRIVSRLKTDAGTQIAGEMNPYKGRAFNFDWIMESLLTKPDLR